MRWGLLALPLLVIAAPCEARSKGDIEARYSKTYAACFKTDRGMTDPGMRDCVGNELTIQDAALNRTYQKAMSRADDAAQKAALKEAQRAWIVFRDADCAVGTSAEHYGSLDRFLAVRCILERTVERTMELEDFIKQSP